MRVLSGQVKQVLNNAGEGKFYCPGLVGFRCLHALNAAVGMSDIQAVPAYVLDPQGFDFPGAQVGNRRKQDS